MSAAVALAARADVDVRMHQVTHMRWLGRAYPIMSYADAAAAVLHTISVWSTAGATDRPRLCAADGRALGYIGTDGKCWIGEPESDRKTCVYRPIYIEPL